MPAHIDDAIIEAVAQTMMQRPAIVRPYEDLVSSRAFIELKRIEGDVQYFEQNAQDSANDARETSLHLWRVFEEHPSAPHHSNLLDQFVVQLEKLAEKDAREHLQMTNLMKKQLSQFRKKLPRETYDKLKVLYERAWVAFVVMDESLLDMALSMRALSAKYGPENNIVAVTNSAAEASSYLAGLMNS